MFTSAITTGSEGFKIERVSAAVTQHASIKKVHPPHAIR